MQCVSVGAVTDARIVTVTGMLVMLYCLSLRVRIQAKERLVLLLLNLGLHLKFRVFILFNPVNSLRVGKTLVLLYLLVRGPTLLLMS